MFYGIYHILQILFFQIITFSDPWNIIFEEKKFRIRGGLKNKSSSVFFNQKDRKFFESGIFNFIENGKMLPEQEENI